MEEAAHRETILHNPAKGNWAAFHWGILEHKNSRDLSLHLLWHSSIWIINQVWQWNWLAVVLSDRSKQCEVKIGLVNYFHAPPRSSLRSLRCSSWACLRWWPSPHGKALLYQQCFPKTETEVGARVNQAYPKVSSLHRSWWDICFSCMHFYSFIDKF